MMKPKYLYHWSIKEIEGEFSPIQLQVLEGQPQNLHRVVYTTNIRNSDSYGYNKL